MPGVDLADQKRQTRAISRKQLSRWYKRVFFHLLDIALVNTYCITRHVPQMSKLSHTECHLTLIEQIIRAYTPAAPQHRPSSIAPSPRRLTERHTRIVMIRSYRRCTVCYARGTRKQTRYQCDDCGKALCPSPCFHIYHTQLDFDDGR